MTTATFEINVDDGNEDSSSPSNSTFNITVNAVNDAPTLSDQSLTLSAIDEDSPVPTDNSSGNLISSLLTGSADVDSGAVNGIAITAVDTTNGSLYYTTNDGSSWSAVGSVANNNALLLANNSNTRIAFVPNSNYNGTSTNILTFRAWDQTSGSAGNKVDTSTNGGTSAFSSSTDTVDITINAVNDAPVATSGSASLTAVDEDSSDPSGDTVSSLFASNFSDATDAVTGGSSADSLAGVVITANAADSSTEGVWQWQANGSNTWNSIATSGLDDDNALFLASNTKLRFLPSSDFNGTPGSLTTRLVDDSSTAPSNGSTVDADPNGNTSVFSSQTVSLGTSINAVNDAPTLSDQSLTLSAIDEDSPVPTDNSSGNLISSLLTGSADVDSGAVNGIAITAVDTTNGSLYYTTNDGSSWSAVGSVANNNALLLANNSNTRIAFVPNSNYNGTSTNILTFRAWDQTSGSAGNKVDTSTNGGTSAFSSSTDTVDITINAVNDAPTLDLNTTDASNNYSFTFTEGGSAQSILNETSGTSLSDVDSSSFDKVTVAFTRSNFADAANDLIINGATGANTSINDLKI